MAAMVQQLTLGTANIGGSYESSRRAEGAVAGARQAMAEFLCCEQEEMLGFRRLEYFYKVVCMW